MASIVAGRPRKSNTSSSSGIAAISLLAGAGGCPPQHQMGLNPLASLAQALTAVGGAVPEARWRLPREVFPSMDTRLAPSPPWARTELAHRKKQSPNAFGSRRAKTLAKVSWEGMPFGNSRKVRNHACLAFP